VFTSSVNTTIQLAVPDAIRGRMMSLYVLVFVGVTPFGAFLTGWLAEHFGIALACVVNGAAALIMIAALSYLRRRPPAAAPGSA
jgi:MFS family permease